MNIPANCLVRHWQTLLPWPVLKPSSSSADWPKPANTSSSRLRNTWNKTCWPSSATKWSCYLQASMAKTLRYWELRPWYGKVSKRLRRLKRQKRSPISNHSIRPSLVTAFIFRITHPTQPSPPNTKEPPLYLLSLQRLSSVDATLPLLLPFLTSLLSTQHSPRN